VRAVFLAGGLVLLRPLERADLAGAYLDWINSQDADRFTDHARYPTNADDLDRYYQSMRGNRNVVHLAVIERASGAHVGNVAIQNIDWIARRGEFAILIGDTRAHGRGIGREAATLLIDHAFRRLALNRVWLGVRADHDVAIGLYRSLGFTEEGRLRDHSIKDGGPVDALIMGLLRREWIQKHGT
jgi:RimJ/RimL family protein N-acetyltransferase